MAFHACLALAAVAAILATSVGQELKVGVLTTWKGGVWKIPESLLGIIPALQTITNDTSVLPGYNLTFLWSDTQCSTRYAAEAAAALLSSDIDVLIGSPCSGDSLLIAPQTTQYRVPMVSYYAVHGGLSNKATYPSFVRVVGAMKTYDLGIISLMRHFSWKHAGLLYPISSGFAVGWADSMRTSFADASFIVDVEVPYGSFGTAQVDQLEGAGARIVIWLDYNCNRAREVYLTAYDHGIMEGWVWISGAISTTCWNQMDARDADSLKSFNGFYAVTAYFPVNQSHFDWLGSMKSQFDPYSQALMGTGARGTDVEINPYGLDYSMDEIGAPTLSSALMYDAILLWAKAAHSLLATGVHPSNLRNITAMREALVSTKVMGLTGEIELTSIGDRKGNSRIDMVSLNAAGDGLDKELIGVYWGVAGMQEIYISNSEFIWAGGQTKLPRDHRVMCEAGKFLPAGSEICEQCPVGRAASLRMFDRPDCDACEPGRFADQRGQQTCFPCSATGATSGAEASACSLCSAGYAKVGTTCVPCAPGLFTNTSLQSECQDCPAGRYFAEVGATECLQCPEGHFAEASAQTVCAKCFLGSRSSSSGASECTSCELTIPDSTTLYPGAAEASECVCPAQTFFTRLAPGDTGKCIACLEGLSCPGGNGAPLQAAGFQAGIPEFSGAEPPSRRVCRSSTICPAGTELGSCPIHRSGAACDICDLGYFEDDQKCISCDDNFGAGPLIAVLVSVVFVIIGLTYYHMIRPAKVYSDSTKTVLLTMMLSINALQSITVLGSITVEWVEPIKSITRIFKLFTLDVNFLNPGCTLAFNEPWKAYLGSILGYPCLAALLLGTALAVKALKLARPVSMLAQVVNLQGSVMLILYLPIAMVAFEPFRCGWNPDGTSTVLSARSIVCWDDSEHTVTVVLSILAVLLYLVPFFAMCIRATMQYRGMVVSAAGWDFLQQYAFLFDRYTSETFWWGLVFLGRSLSIGIVQAHLVNYPVWQILLLSMIFTANMVAVSLVWPWRTRLANWLDISFSGALQVILIGAAVLIKSDDGVQELLQYIFFIALLAAMVLSLLILGKNSYTTIRAPKEYRMFLSHHKLGAQALARWMKIVISERLPNGQKVFLDSDELRRIDLIVEIVSKNISNLVVLLTKETLSRFWCAIEIATAIEQGVPVVSIACNDYVPISDGFIASLKDLWTKSQHSDLARLGFTMAQMQAAYSSFRGLTTSPLDRKAGLCALFGAVDEIMKSCASGASSVAAVTSRAGAEPSNTSGQAPVVSITSSLTDPEMLCSADVLRLLLQAALQVKIEILSHDDCEQRWQQLAGSKYLLVVLSSDIVECTLFAATAMLVNKSSGLAAVPVMTETPFVFPGDAFWCKLQDGEFYTLAGFDADKLQEAYGDLFGTISMSLFVASNQRTIKAQILEMKDRLPDAKVGKFSRPILGESSADFKSTVTTCMCRPAKSDVGLGPLQSSSGLGPLQSSKV